MKRWGYGVVLACTIAACSDPPPGLVDASDATAPAVTVADPAPPAAPGAPRFGACPDGWRARDAGEGATVCEPWAGDRAPPCASDELAIPGAGCEPIDTCPADGWPAELPAFSVVYVRAGAADGDGTRGRPFGTLAEGLAAARGRDAIVALAVGEYEGGTDVSMDNRELRGACARGTLIRDDTTGPNQATLTVRVRDARMSGLRIRGGSRALWLAQRASLDARDLLLEASVAGLRLDSDASFTGERVRVRAATDTSRAAVELRPRTRLTLRRSTITGGTDAAIGAYTTDTATSADIAVTLEDSAVLDGRAAVIGFTTEIVVRRCALERLLSGVATILPESRVELTDVRARDLRSTAADRAAGYFASVLLVAGGHAHVSRLLASDGTDWAIVAQGADAEVVAEDVVVEDYEVSSSVFEADDGGSLEVSRARLRMAGGPAVRATASRLVARDLDVTALAALPHPLVLVHGGTILLERARGHAPPPHAFALATSGGRLEASDVDVVGASGVIAQCAPEVGHPCEPGAESEIVLTRARFRDIYRYAVASHAARVTVRDLDVDSVEGGGPEGGGYGLVVGGACVAERVRIRRSTRQSILVAQSGSLTATDLRVEDAQAVRYSEEARLAGDAVICGLGGRMTIERFVLAGSYRSGLALATACEHAELSHGSITGNAIGLLSDRAERAPQLVNVRIAGNETDFNTTEIVVDPPVLPSE